jgi:hypothetical protein
LGKDALRGHGLALDVEDAQSRLLWNSVSRRVARGGCLREHARCANAGPDRGAATGDAGNGAQVANQTQPVKLVVNNAPAAATAGARTYTFEVASDVAFTTKVQTKDGVAEGSGQTSVTLDPLTSVKDYYWRARAQTGTTPGTFSDPFKFTIGAAITLAAPAPIGPLTNAETTPRPALRVSNASRSGPTGAITYKFEIARDSSFGSTSSSARTRKASTRPVSFRRAICRRASFCTGEPPPVMPPTASRARRAPFRRSRRGRSHKPRPSPIS